VLIDAPKEAGKKLGKKGLLKLRGKNLSGLPPEMVAENLENLRRGVQGPKGGAALGAAGAGMVGAALIDAGFGDLFKEAVAKTTGGREEWLDQPPRTWRDRDKAMFDVAAEEAMGLFTLGGELHDVLKDALTKRGVAGVEFVGGTPVVQIDPQLMEAGPARDPWEAKEDPVYMDLVEQQTQDDEEAALRWAAQAGFEPTKAYRAPGAVGTTVETK